MACSNGSFGRDSPAFGDGQPFPDKLLTQAQLVGLSETRHHGTVHSAT